MKGHVITSGTPKGGIERFRQGDALTAERLNALVDAVNALARVQPRDGFSADAALGCASPRRRPFEVFDLVESGGKVSCSVAPGGIFGSGSDPRASWFFPGAKLKRASAGELLVVVWFGVGGSSVGFSRPWIYPAEVSTLAPTGGSMSAALMTLVEYNNAGHDGGGLICATLAKKGGRRTKQQILHSDFFFQSSLASQWRHFSWDNEP